MDPITAALNLLASINNVINTLLSHASATADDAIIQDYLARQERVEAVLAWLCEKLGVQLPATPPATPSPAPVAANITPSVPAVDITGKSTFVNGDTLRVIPNRG